MKLNYIPVAAFMMLTAAGTIQASAAESNFTIEASIGQGEPLPIYSKSQVNALLTLLVQDLTYALCVEDEYYLMFDLGMDSLLVYQLCLDTEDMFGICLNMEYVLNRAPYMMFGEYVDIVYDTMSRM